MTQESLFPMPQTVTTSDDYWTPRSLFDTLGLEFDLDVACPPEGPLHTPARAWYTQETDGLASPWWGRVWMNPPFSNPGPWVQKFIEHNNGLGIVPTSNGKWLTELWGSEVLLTLPVPIKFICGQKQIPASIPTRCYLIGTRQYKTNLQRFNKVR